MTQQQDRRHLFLNEMGLGPVWVRHVNNDAKKLTWDDVKDFGSGDHGAKWFFISGQPSAPSGEQGDTLSGAAGDLLDNMLKAMGLARTNNVYISNTTQCLLTDGVEGEALALCRSRTLAQIKLLQPVMIVAFGLSAARLLLDDVALAGKTVDSLRGSMHQYNNISFIVTHHPADLLVQPDLKRQAWDDLRLAMRTYDEKVN